MSFGTEKPPPRKISLERDNHAYQRRQEGEGEGRGEPVHALPRLAGGRWKRGSARDAQSYMLNRLLDDVASSKLLALDEFGCVSFDAVGARLLCQAMPGGHGRSAMFTENAVFSRWSTVFTAVWQLPKVRLG